MQILFWCEFPEKVKWEDAKKLINFKTAIYVAVKTRKDYDKWEKRIKSKNIEVGAWPVLGEGEGYWFSGFVEKGSIDKLKQFQGLKVKIDIEPPFPGKGFKITKLLFNYFLPYFLARGKNNDYLEKTIRGMKGNLIISGFPLPSWVSKRYGDITELGSNMQKNFISYTTLFSTNILKWHARRFIKKTIKRYENKAMFAVGCTGKGIFGDESIYENIQQLKDDLEMVKKAGAENIVIFNLEGVMDRNDRDDWFELIKKFISS